jgi:hypothetical protein
MPPASRQLPILTQYGRREPKRRKRKSVSDQTRYLIACAYLIFISKPPRPRDADGQRISLKDASTKRTYSLSDLSQEEMTNLYFVDIERSTISKIKPATTSSSCRIGLCSNHIYFHGFTSLATSALMLPDVSSST